jgi:hypothetical protein
MASNLNFLASLIGIGLGLFAHLGFFIHGEWHLQAPLIFLFHVILNSFLSTGMLLHSNVFENSHASKLWTAGLIASLYYLASLMSSMFIYRIYFHRLARAGFKGPFYMRVSKIFHVWKCRTSQNHLLLDGLQNKYGDFIRTGLYPVPHATVVFRLAVN